MAMAMVLTACGGGGDTGPQWAQDAKDSQIHGGLSLAAGTFYSPCVPLLAGAAAQSVVNINVIEKTQGSYYLTVKDEYYDDLACSASKKLLTVTKPKARMAYVQLGKEAITGLTYQEVEVISNGGAVSFVAEDNAPVTVTAVTATTARITFTTSGLNFTVGSTEAQGGSYHDIYAFDQRSMYLGDPDTRDSATAPPSELKIKLPYRPYRFLGLTPGTYAQECTSIDLPEPNLTVHTYGVIEKFVVDSLSDDYRPHVSLQRDYFTDLACTDRLVTVVSTPIYLETVGNGVDANANGVTFMQVVQLVQAGTFTATIDPAVGNAGRVTVANGTVTFVNDNVAFSLPTLTDSVVYDVVYFEGDSASIYIGDQDTINSDVSPFPTQLLLDSPYTKE